MKLLIMGPPGSGKTTVGRLLSKRLDLPLISLGKILRNLPKDHPRYNELKKAMDEGLNAPDSAVGEVLMEELKSKEYEGGYVLDGWARRMSNILFFDPEPDKVIYLDASEDIALERILGRRTCEMGGAVCNIYTLPPLEEGTCDVCDGPLKKRDDDNEAVFRKRAEVFDEETTGVVNYFDRKGILQRVNAEKLPSEIVEEISQKLGLKNDKD